MDIDYAALIITALIAIPLLVLFDKFLFKKEKVVCSQCGHIKERTKQDVQNTKTLNIATGDFIGAAEDVAFAHVYNHAMDKYLRCKKCDSKEPLVLLESPEGRQIAEKFHSSHTPPISSR